MRRRFLFGLGLAALLFLLPASGLTADRGWVRGEIRLNIRTGPGTEFKIVGVAKTGDALDVLQREEGWTRIRVVGPNAKIREGWIPEGYLNPTPPPTLRLAQAEERVADLSARFEALQQEAEALRQETATLSTTNSAQKTELDQVTQENMRLHAGDRYPEWITGASILAAGMLLGSLIYRSSTRRQQTRIRL